MFTILQNQMIWLFLFIKINKTSPDKCLRKFQAKLCVFVSKQNKLPTNWLKIMFFWSTLFLKMSTIMIFYCKHKENTQSLLSGLYFVHHLDRNCVIQYRCARAKLARAKIAAPITLTVHKEQNCRNHHFPGEYCTLLLTLGLYQDMIK